MRSFHLAWLGSGCLSIALWAFGCGDDPRPPPFTVDPGASGGSSSSSGGSLIPTDDCERPPEPDDSRLCGSELVPVLQQKPNLYFVLDVSSSMLLTMDGGATDRLTVAKNALNALLYDIGHLVNYGVAVFPANGADPSGEGSCAAGQELFPTTEGDPVQCTNIRRAGPVLRYFMNRLSPIAATGGTPLGATLEALTPTITALDGSTAVVLITDGAPNCGLTPCEASECMLNVEGFYYRGEACSDDLHCCDPEVVDTPLAPLNCVDRSNTLAAVTALAEQGIKTYIVGIPGTEFYVDLLDQLAEAGGTAQEGTRKYFAINDSAALRSALKAIGSDVAISCDIALKSSTYEPHLTNVYFDAALVPASETDGWTFADQSITVHGSYCDQLLAGEIGRVQVVSGCPTVIR